MQLKFEKETRNKWLVTTGAETAFQPDITFLKHKVPAEGKWFKNLFNLRNVHILEMFQKLYFTQESEIYYSYTKKYYFLLLERISCFYFLTFWIYIW